MQPRVLMLVSRFHPAIGGVESHVRELSKRLQKLNFKITVLTAAHESALTLVEIQDTLRIIRIPFHWKKCLPLVWLWLLRERNSLRGHDIVHIHDVFPPLFWYLPARIFNVKKRVHLTYHGYESDPVPVLLKILRRVMRKVVRFTMCIGYFIPKIYGHDCDSISIGAVDSHKVDSLDSSGAIYVGRLEHDTGLMEYLQAIKILRDEKGITLPLTICGGGSLKDEILRYAERENLDITCIGYVKNPVEIIRNRKMMFAAGYLSILDSLSNGVPVIGLAATPLRQAYLHGVIQAGGVISIQTTAEGVAREIYRLLRSNLLFEQISKKGREFALAMTWDRMTQEYIKLWTKVTYG
jgi:glycosyltransferase involved in cell wall biosynthesis